MALALRDAGCKEAWIGAESGSQKSLGCHEQGHDGGGDPHGTRAARSASEFASDFSFSWDTSTSNSRTSWRRAICWHPRRPDEIGVSVSYPLPGTKFYELVKAQLRAKTHWQESNDLDMMFQGTYTSDFYRAVRNLLHDQIALQTADAPLLPEHERATDAIEHRWQELSRNELKYRSPSQKSAATA